MPSLNQMLARLSDLFAGPGKAIPMSNRNGFIDGAFEVTSGGGTTMVTGGAYTQAVMWLAQAGVGGAGSCGCNSMRTGPGVMSMSDTNPHNSFYITMTTGSTGTLAGRNLPAFWQKLEWMNKYAGKSVTLSMKMWVQSGSPNMAIPAVCVTQGPGTGGSPSANVDCTKVVNWTVTPTIQKFSVRVDLPSMAGITLGTNVNDFTQFGIWLAPNWTGTLYIMEPQVELCSPNSSGDINGAGGAPTAFEYRGFALEYVRAMRYWQQLNSWQTSMYSVVGGNVTTPALVRSVPMRAIPAMSTSNVQTSGCTGVAIPGSTPELSQTYLTGVGANAPAWAACTVLADARL